VATLTAESDLVFVGTVSAELEQRSEAAGRLQEIEGSEGFPISRFVVSPEQVVSGGLSRTMTDTVIIEQPGGEMTRSDGTVVEVSLEGDEPLEVGRQYLFFASAKENGTLAAPPFGKLPIVGGAIVAPEGWATIGAVQQLAGLQMSAALAEVEDVR
jgi:hypothetical protein